MDCPSEQQIVEVFELPRPQLSDELVSHLDACSACRQLVGFYQTGPSDESESSDPVLSVGANLGRYEIVDLIASGAFGSVYEAHDPKLERPVALKVLRQRAPQAASVELLLDEARAMAKVSSAHVVGVYDADVTDDGLVYMAMELIDGVTLRRWMITPRPWRQVLDVLLAVGAGIADIHAAGLLHRDIKPENILIAADGSVKIGDLGVSGRRGDLRSKHVTVGIDATLLTVDNVIAGTPAYMAPELLDGQPPHTQSDVFAFAATCYEALSGCRPFAGSTLAELRESMKGQMQPGDARYPSRLRAAIQRGLADARERHATIAEMLAHMRNATRRAGTKIAVGAAAVAVVGVVGVALFMGRSASAPLCGNVGQEVEETWNPGQRSKLSALISKREGSITQPVRYGLGELDRYAQRWTHERREVCEAARVRKSISDTEFDRRMRCLDDGLEQLSVTVETIGTHGTEENILAIVGAVRPPSECEQSLADAGAATPNENPRGGP